MFVNDDCIDTYTDDKADNVCQAFPKRCRLTGTVAIIIAIVINRVKILSKSMLTYQYSTFSMERCQNLFNGNNEFGYKIL
ncbi:MAG: hypothetical protein DYG89_06545 [Caldilinea sp. CFX5]|nr:hypothetical protein [Caldilinea sp. CFX5]